MPVARRGAALEGLDDDHAAAAARARMREWLRLAGVGAGGAGRVVLGLWNGEQFAGSGDVVGAGTVGEQSVVADAVEAVRQDVDEKAADELAGGQCHDLLATIGTIVFPSEGD